MAKPNLHASKEPQGRHSYIESALRTLDAGAEGIAALAKSIRDGLGASFIAAVDLIRGAKGRVIVTGMGKSGHVARKIAATLASTGTPAFFVHPGRGQSRRSRHGHARRRHHGAVVVGRNRRTQEPDRLFQAFPHRSRRHHRGRREHARQGCRCCPGAAAGARSLPAQSRAHHVHAHAAWTRRRSCHRAAGQPRLHRGRFRSAASGRPAWSAAQIRPRCNAWWRFDPAGADRHQNVGRRARNVGQGIWLRRHHRRPGQADWHRHRWRPAPPYAQRSAQRPGRNRHDPWPEDSAARPARQRGAGAASTPRRSRRCSLSMAGDRWGSSISTTCCGPERPSRRRAAPAQVLATRGKS